MDAIDRPEISEIHSEILRLAENRPSTGQFWTFLAPEELAALQAIATRDLVPLATACLRYRDELVSYARQQLDSQAVTTLMTLQKMASSLDAHAIAWLAGEVAKARPATAEGSRLTLVHDAEAEPFTLTLTREQGDRLRTLAKESSCTAGEMAARLYADANQYINVWLCMPPAFPEEQQQR